MANFKKTIATARERVAKTEIEAFKAGLEAIYAILQDASPHDVLTLCPRALADVAPNCCEAHQDEFKPEFLRVRGDCIAIRQEQKAAETNEDDDEHRQVH
jgi:hypothetical protein